MTTEPVPHYRLSASALADWIEKQPDKWWCVDGEPLLTSIVDFPCPSDELTTAVRRVGKDLMLKAQDPSSAAHGEMVGVDRLDDLAHSRNKKHRKVLQLSWKGSDVDWLLIEDEALGAR
jgi:hypothetical protein